jgi:F0F1-type ATP synthase assembly protein I
VKENNQNLDNGNGPWWKPAVELLSEVSTWIVVPIVCALIFGKMLDAHFGTKPRIFLIFAGIGFLVTCFGMFRIIKNYMKNLQDTEEKK